MREVDLRSDTVTHPSPEMRRAMAEAELGDDVFGDDPTLNRLEAMAAERLGKEAAVFVASGTMGNLVSILTHAGRGDEIIIGDKAHIFRSEAGGASALGGVAYNTLPNDSRGMLDLDQLEAAIKPPNVHFTRTAMIGLENTHNACGGAPLTADDTAAVAEIAHRHSVPLHIDGARIFNASVALETPVTELVKDADSVSFCLSKGLSCPIGSVVCGSAEFIEGARKWRKVVGGGMRQVGVVAAAGIVALDNMVERLNDDHATARRLANGLSQIPGIEIKPDALPTNLVFFKITGGDPALIMDEINRHGVKGGAAYGDWRFVTHYGIDSDDIDYALNVMDAACRKHASA